MFYLGATASEMANFQVFSKNLAYMACHFSSSSNGISNIPTRLPSGSLLLLDDQIPPADHDPAQVIRELCHTARAFSCSGVYLDFQRKGYPLLAEIAAQTKNFPCPVAVSQLYSSNNHLPVVLPPVPPDAPLSSYIAPWQGREIWLEAAMDRKKLILTAQGCHNYPWEEVPEQGFREERLCCHYSIQTRKGKAIFHLWRTYEDLQDLIAQAKSLGITHTLGLWQEFSAMV